MSESEIPPAAPRENGKEAAAQQPPELVRSEVEQRRGHWLGLAFMPLPFVVISLFAISMSPFLFLGILIGYLFWAAFCSFRLASCSGRDQPSLSRAVGGCLAAVAILLILLIGLLWGACSEYWI